MKRWILVLKCGFNIIFYADAERVNEILKNIEDCNGDDFLTINNHVVRYSEIAAILDMAQVTKQ